MKRIDRNQNWKLRIMDDTIDAGAYIPAIVPGSVYNDLTNAGRMEDPYWRDNEMEALELMKNDFEYRGSFDVDADELAGADEAILRFGGLQHG